MQFTGHRLLNTERNGIEKSASATGRTRYEIIFLIPQKNMNIKMNCADWRRWLMILQVIAVKVCVESKKNDHDEEFVVEGCTSTLLNLSCDRTKEIEILTVVLGDSECEGKNCCIKASDCIVAPSKNHLLFVKTTCNGQQSCRVQVSYEPIRNCSRLNPWKANDFERIIYRCKTETGTATSSTRDQTTHPNMPTAKSPTETPSAGDDGRKTEDVNANKKNAFILPTVVGIVIFVIFIIIVAVVIIIRRRRKNAPPVKYDMEMSNANCSSETEAVCVNDKQLIVSHNSTKQTGNTTAVIAKGVYDRARSVVYSVIGKTDSMVQEDQTNVYCDVDEKDMDHPRDNVYSLARDSCEVRHGSHDGTIYNNVETKQNHETEAAKHNTETYEEVRKWEGSATTNHKQEHGLAGIKLMAVGKDQDGYANVRTPSYVNAGEIANGCSGASNPSSMYQPMSPGAVPQGVYANEIVLSPRSLSGRGSETDSQYCAMQSPRVQLKEDGMVIVEENELYGGK